MSLDGQGVLGNGHSHTDASMTLLKRTVLMLRANGTISSSTASLLLAPPAYQVCLVSSAEHLSYFFIIY